MQILACDGDWSIAGATASCVGTLHTVQASESLSGITIEDAQELAYSAMGLFAIVFALLALKKAFP